MKTTVEKVRVEVLDNGRPRVRAYYIQTPGGKLMTQRLKRLMKGKIPRNSPGVYRDEHGDDYDGDHILFPHDIYYVGMVWEPPYQLLKELAQDRLELQYELYMLEGPSYLTRFSPILVLPEAKNETITKMVQDELTIRECIKNRIKELDRTKEKRDAEALKECETTARETTVCACGAWELDESCSVKAPPAKAVTPYEW